MRPTLQKFLIVELEYWHMALETLSASFSQSVGGATLHLLRRDWTASASAEQVTLSSSTDRVYEAFAFTHCQRPDIGKVALGVLAHEVNRNVATGNGRIAALAWIIAESSALPCR